MEALKYAKAEDRVEQAMPNGSLLLLDGLSGVWVNTNSASRGITKVVIAVQAANLVVRVFGAGDPDPYDWGEREAEHLYANSISSHAATGFTVRYLFEYSEIELQANWNQGLLVLANFTVFKDGSKRSNYFSREFFYR
ncbi:MAG: hypothetical protein LAO78_10225 [Acidobacteriia bacterium]|nr:hypothetical protein [Terriglobia bacterium]